MSLSYSLFSALFLTEVYKPSALFKQFQLPGITPHALTDCLPSFLFLSIEPPPPAPSYLFICPMVCCQAQNCCLQFISFSGATVLTGLLSPFLSVPVFWLLSFLHPILTGLSFRRILYTDHEGQSQMCLAYFPLTGSGWHWPKSFSFSCNSVMERTCHWRCCFMVGSGSIQEDRIIKGFF